MPLPSPLSVHSVLTPATRFLLVSLLRVAAIAAVVGLIVGWIGGRAIGAGTASTGAAAVAPALAVLASADPWAGLCNAFGIKNPVKVALLSRHRQLIGARAISPPVGRLGILKGLVAQLRVAAV